MHPPRAVADPGRPSSEPWAPCDRGRAARARFRPGRHPFGRAAGSSPSRFSVSSTGSQARPSFIPPRYQALARYLVVGGANTVLSYVVFRGAFAALRQVPNRAAIAQAISYAIGITIGFLAHSAVTFQVERRSREQLFRYVVVQVVCMVTSAMLVQLLIEHAHLPPTAAWVLVTGFITVANFVLQRMWVFAPSVRAVD